MPPPLSHRHRWPKRCHICRHSGSRSCVMKMPLLLLPSASCRCYGSAVVKLPLQLTSHSCRRYRHCTARAIVTAAGIAHLLLLLHCCCRAGAATTTVVQLLPLLLSRHHHCRINAVSAAVMELPLWWPLPTTVVQVPPPKLLCSCCRCCYCGTTTVAQTPLLQLSWSCHCGSRCPLPTATAIMLPVQLPLLQLLPLHRSHE